ncbi:chemotaxis protein CheB [Actinoplanes sp. NPDC051343]|uniref:chemotaxis protein CheB n=1 Tax=Actinoplanes sp. NPDC051343 TaxID=3363906 RepID=UPI0037A7A091
MIAVVLWGALEDGAAGLAAIAGRGGLGLVQQPGRGRVQRCARAARPRCPPPSRLARSSWRGGSPNLPAGRGHVLRTVRGSDLGDHIIRDGNSKAAHVGRPVELGCPERSGDRQRRALR